MANDYLKKEIFDIFEKNFDSKIEDIKNLVKDGFKGVHTRQDKTNGNVTKNTKWRHMITGGLILTNLILLPTFFILLAKYFDKI